MVTFSQAELHRLAHLLFEEWRLKGYPDDEHMARGWVARKNDLAAELRRRGTQLTIPLGEL